MARGSTASQGRVARSELPSRSPAFAGKATDKIERAMERIQSSALTQDGKIDAESFVEAAKALRADFNYESGSSPSNPSDFMADLSSKLGKEGQSAASGIITDAVELSYLRSARQARMDDIAKGSEESPRAVQAQYDAQIKDLETSLKSGLDELVSMKGGKEWASKIVDKIEEYSLNMTVIGSGKSVSRYDSKSIRKAINDVYETLNK